MSRWSPSVLPRTGGPIDFSPVTRGLATLGDALDRRRQERERREERARLEQRQDEQQYAGAVERGWRPAMPSGPTRTLAAEPGVGPQFGIGGPSMGQPFTAAPQPGDAFRTGSGRTVGDYLRTQHVAAPAPDVPSPTATVARIGGRDMSYDPQRIAEEAERAAAPERRAALERTLAIARNKALFEQSLVASQQQAAAAQQRAAWNAANPDALMPEDVDPGMFRSAYEARQTRQARETAQRDTQTYREDALEERRLARQQAAAQRSETQRLREASERESGPLGQRRQMKQTRYSQLLTKPPEDQDGDPIPFSPQRALQQAESEAASYSHAEMGREMNAETAEHQRRIGTARTPAEAAAERARYRDALTRIAQRYGVLGGRPMPAPR